MTGAEHYREAERLLIAAERGQDDHGLIDRQRALATAGVHATLALAAATGLNPRMRADDAYEWQCACSTTEAPA